jgi:hypothetical protein
MATPKPHHHCTYSLVRNPKYTCARVGTKLQSATNTHYCTFHDQYTKDRCQELVRYMGTGACCDMIAVGVDNRSGRRVCRKHSREEVELDSGEKQAGIVEDVKSGTGAEGGESVIVMESSLKGPAPSIAESDIDPEATTPPIERFASNSALSSSPQCCPVTSPPTPPNSPPSSRHLPLPVAPLNGGKISVLAAVLVHEPRTDDRIAAMYVQCNVCLEKHAAAVMRSTPGCGHRYRELCVDIVLRRGIMRPYNCSKCREWMMGLKG